MADPGTPRGTAGNFGAGNGRVELPKENHQNSLMHSSCCIALGWDE